MTAYRTTSSKPRKASSTNGLSSSAMANDGMRELYPTTQGASNAP